MKKYIKVFFVELIIVLMFFGYLLYNQKNEDNLANYNTSYYIKKDEYIDDEDTEKLYKKLEQGLLEGNTKVSINLENLFIEPKKIFSILENISYENPEVMYYKGAEYSLGKVELIYSDSIKHINKHQEQIKNEKDLFFKNYIRHDMSDYEKILAIHDYIINNGEYDKRLFSEGEVPPESYSTYGILALGVGVCESYAKSMKYFLDEAGIDSMIVIGTSRGENHAWNLVKIEGEYYHIDTTWDDPVIEDGSQVVRHNFFNLNDEQIEKTHEWDREQYPEAKGTQYNYYKYNNLVVLGEAELRSKLEKAILQRIPKYSLKILDFNKDIVINEIIEEIGYNNYNKIMLKEYSYYLDKEQGIVSFQFYYH